MNGSPKPTFYVAVALVIAALVGFAIYRSDLIAPAPDKPDPGAAPIDPMTLPTSAENPSGEPALMATEAAKVFMMVSAYLVK